MAVGATALRLVDLDGWEVYERTWAIERAFVRTSEPNKRRFQ
jgi:hypothetical protein